MSNNVKTNWSGYHPDKDDLRAEVWSLLKQQGVAIRDPFGHIPNFVGAQKAAEQLAGLPIWQRAKAIKCNPDSPQIPVRSRALQDGKRLYMAVPRLTNTRCFVELTAEDLQQRNIPLEEAAIARKALTYGRLVSFEQMQAIDLVMVGCVAVTRNGGRTGKGAGFADLELAMLKEFGLVQSDTPIVTTVHPLQIVEADFSRHVEKSTPDLTPQPPSLPGKGENSKPLSLQERGLERGFPDPVKSKIVEEERLPMQAHDWALHWIVTPEEVIETNTTYSRPAGLDWDSIRPEQFKKIPILRKLREQLTT